MAPGLGFVCEAGGGGGGGGGEGPPACICMEGRALVPEWHPVVLLCKAGGGGGVDEGSVDIHFPIEYYKSMISIVVRVL